MEILFKPETIPEVSLEDAVKSVGLANAKIMIIGDAPAEQEQEKKVPFVGPSGRYLRRVIEDYYPFDSCFLTNVFRTQPPGNNILHFFGNEVNGPGYIYNNKKFYVKPEYNSHLKELGRELERVRPNIVIALGNTARWFMTSSNGTSIDDVRGYIVTSNPVYGLYKPKTLITHHPSAVLRTPRNRITFRADIAKGIREAETSLISYTTREINVPQSIEDLEACRTELLSAPFISIDIETKYNSEIITYVGFAWDANNALVIPFWYNDDHYWKSLEEEVEAWMFVREILTSPNPKLGQNFIYDMQCFLAMGLHVVNFQYDTMIGQHALFCELRKGLGFLGSLYTSEMPWKSMRNTEEKRK